jgi:hypothetical protein
MDGLARSVEESHEVKLTYDHSVNRVGRKTLAMQIHNFAQLLTKQTHNSEFSTCIQGLAFLITKTIKR